MDFGTPFWVSFLYTRFSRLRSGRTFRTRALWMPPLGLVMDPPRCRCRKTTRPRERRKRLGLLGATGIAEGSAWTFPFRENDPLPNSLRLGSPLLRRVSIGRAYAIRSLF